LKVLVECKNVVVRLW